MKRKNIRKENTLIRFFFLFDYLCSVWFLRKFEGKFKEKKIEKKKIEGKNVKKIKINKVFLHVNSNLFYLF